MAMLALGLVVACASTPPVPQPTGTGSAPSAPAPTGQSPGPPSPAGSDASVTTIAQMPACQLIFKTEAAAAIGVPIEQSQEEGGESDPEGWRSECVYYRQPSFDQAPLDVTIASGARYRAVFDDLKTEPGSTVRSGLGDEAFLRMSTIAGLDEPVGALFIRLGNALIGLSLGIVDLTDDGGMTLAGDAAAQAQMLDSLAALAVSRLASPPTPAPKTCPLVAVADVVGLSGVSVASAEDIDEHDVWGPACQYKTADDVMQLDITVNHGPTAQANFEACKVGANAVVGAGDEAFRTVRPCTINIGGRFISEPFIVRAGDTYIAVAINEIGELGYAHVPDLDLKLARLTLERLGLKVGTTPSPTGFDILAHPCALVPADQAGSIMHEAITETSETAITVDGPGGGCEYSTAAGSLYPPLTVGVTIGDADARWATAGDLSKDEHVPLPGLGDEAFSETFPPDPPFDPTVHVYVRRGELILQLFSDAVPTTDGERWVAAGTAAEQLQMLTQLAQLILPQLPQ
jgi:hypothetical protein